MTLEDKMVANIYNLDEEKLAEKTVRTSATRATAEEVSVFKVKDAADVGMVQDAINERIEDQKIAYENYVPAEMAKINNAAVYTNGSYVILVMADDTSKVEELFQAQFWTGAEQPGNGCSVFRIFISERPSTIVGTWRTAEIAVFIFSD